MQNKGLQTHFQSALDFFFSVFHMTTKRPFLHPEKTLNFLIIRSLKKQHLKLLICLWNDPGSARRRLSDRGWCARTRMWRTPDKTLLLQHWQRSEARPPSERGRHCSWALLLSLRGPDPFYMPCSPAITMTQFLLKTVSQIAERSRAGTRAFKRSCPLEFNYAWCWVLLQKVLCQEFLIMLRLFFFSLFLFCPQGYKSSVELGRELKPSLIRRHRAPPQNDTMKMFYQCHVWLLLFRGPSIETSNTHIFTHTF